MQKVVPVHRGDLFPLMAMKKLRSGYTTGACAAAAAKGAALSLLGRSCCSEVDIPFPDGRRVTFALERCILAASPPSCTTAVIKDAGDDPDVTNGAAICATVRYKILPGPGERVAILGGEGVGRVTKPGLAVTVGEAAINPVPRRMIETAVQEAIDLNRLQEDIGLEVEISVPAGRELARQTLNERLGIIGGISILGTTGIVRPISADAWTATISTAMEVAAAGNNPEIVLSTGRTSETALQRLATFPAEAYIMMGDYLEFALQEARKFPFSRLHMAGMWAKIVKAALRIPQTHVRFGALEIAGAIELIEGLAGPRRLGYLDGANTARELYDRLVAHGDESLTALVCESARAYHQELSGKSVTVYLVHHNGTIVQRVG